MNKTHDPPPELVDALQGFYKSYFPDPCPFELPEGEYNDFMYVWERYSASGRIRHLGRSAFLLRLLALLAASAVGWAVLPRRAKASVKSLFAGLRQGFREALCDEDGSVPRRRVSNSDLPLSARVSSMEKNS